MLRHAGVHAGGGTICCRQLSLATMAGLVILFALVANAFFGLFGSLLVRGITSALHKLECYGEFLDRWRRRFRFICTADRERVSRFVHTHPPIGERAVNGGWPAN